MPSVPRLSRWRRIAPVALCLVGLFVLAGCEDNATKEPVAATHPDATKNLNAMEEYQKKNPKFGKPGGSR